MDSDNIDSQKRYEHVKFADSITYMGATVLLPGTFDENSTEKRPKAYGSTVRFLWQGCHVSAHIPTGIWQQPQLLEEFVDPVVNMVSRDLETTASLIPELTEHAKRKTGPEILMYSVVSAGKTFRVHDCSSTPPGQVMDMLLIIKNTDQRVLNPEYNAFFPLAERVGREEKGLVYVEGKSLRHATDSAIQIYNFANELRAIKEGRPLVKSEEEQ